MYILYEYMDPYTLDPYRTLMDPLKEPLWYPETNPYSRPLKEPLKQLLPEAAGVSMKSSGFGAQRPQCPLIKEYGLNYIGLHIMILTLYSLTRGYWALWGISGALGLRGMVWRLGV